MKHGMSRQSSRRLGRQACTLLAVVLAAAAVVTTAFARSAAVPQNTAAPTITGNEHEGDTLTANNGTWSNAPTKFEYQWQRCSSGGTGCTDISGATAKTYTVAAADSDNTLRVTVTASNADGQSSASSKVTDVVSSKGGPVNTAKPTISGTVKVGEELTASNGTWTGGVKSYAYQWQRCETSGSGCVDVTGASGSTYGVRAADVGKSLRVIVTATNASGSTATSSVVTAAVPSASGGTTAVPVPAKAGNKAPTISFLSLKKSGLRVYARFRVCDDSSSRISVIERDTKTGKLGYTRRFSVPGPSCSTSSRNWVPAARFRTPGRLVVTLRAIDKSGKSSGTVSRGLALSRAGV